MVTSEALFVYGTLRVGQPAHGLVQPYIAHLEPATINGRLVALPGGYPGLTLHAHHAVIGDLLLLDRPERALLALDAYEGDEYLRERHPVTTRDGRSVIAWCYVLARPEQAVHHATIASGDWVAYKQRGIRVESP